MKYGIALNWIGHLDSVIHEYHKVKAELSVEGEIRRILAGAKLRAPPVFRRIDKALKPPPDGLLLAMYVIEL